MTNVDSVCEKDKLFSAWWIIIIIKLFLNQLCSLEYVKLFFKTATNSSDTNYSTKVLSLIPAHVEQSVEISDFIGAKII